MQIWNKFCRAWIRFSFETLVNQKKRSWMDHRRITVFRSLGTMQSAAHQYSHGYSIHTLRIQICPNKGITPIFLFWGRDWDHQFMDLVMPIFTISIAMYCSLYMSVWLLDQQLLVSPSHVQSTWRDVTGFNCFTLFHFFLLCFTCPFWRETPIYVCVCAFYIVFQ